MAARRPRRPDEEEEQERAGEEERPLDSGTVQSLREADPSRLDRLPNIDVRVTGHQHVRRIDSGHDAALLGARDQVVDEHTHAALGAGPG